MSLRRKQLWECGLKWFRRSKFPHQTCRQAIGVRASDSSSGGPADNPSDSSGDSGGNGSDDDDDPSGVSVGDQLAMGQVFIEFNGVLAEPQFREKLKNFERN